jgi:hypothetical protein
MENLINTGTLIAADQIIPAVQNLYDWNRLYMNSKLFALMNNLGLVDATVPSGSGGKGNYAVHYNKSTGMKTDYTCVADITPKAGKIDLKTINSSSRLDTSSAFTFVNINAREGLALRINGSAVDDAGATKEFSALFRIYRVDDADDWYVRLVDSTLKDVADADECDSITTGSFVLVEECAEFGGSAPVPDDLTTTQDVNYIQMFDTSYGKNMVAASQLTKYDNSMETLYRTVEPAFYSKINSALWFGHRGYAPQASYDYGAMKGIWGWLNLSDPSLNTDQAKPTIKVDTGTDIDLWSLAKTFAERGTDAPEKVHCYTTSKMSVKLAQAANDAKEVVRTEMVSFPKMTFKKRSIMIGDTELIIIVDDKLKYHPKFYDGTNTAAQEHVMICLDPRSTMLTYHNNSKLGVMAPAVRPVFNERDRRTEEDHMIAALTLGMWNMHNHVAFGITNS